VLSEKRYKKLSDTLRTRANQGRDACDSDGLTAVGFVGVPPFFHAINSFKSKSLQEIRKLIHGCEM